MRNPARIHSYEVVAELPESLRPLHALTCNFRWTWHHETRELFREIEEELWERVEHNPIQLIAQLPHDRLLRLAEDSMFLAKLQYCSKNLESYLSRPTWFETEHPELVGNLRIAYFCAEFGVSEALPIYSGGLGILAGDHLKAASDLGLPLVGIGLLYSRGYFRQSLTFDGWQQETYQQYDFYQLPLVLVRSDDGQPVRISVEMPDRNVTCQVWKAEVGRIPLYLLDSNILENAPNDQSITDTLYGGDEEMRIRQELILGVGGMRALKAVGYSPTVCHMNEGHAAFLTLERTRQYMQEQGCDFVTARQTVINGNVFTTHTPVPAGFDVFHEPLLERYLGSTVRSLGQSMESFIERGRLHPEASSEAFNMAVYALDSANHVNGVSQLHASVTRELFQDRWPDFRTEDVPISAVTNGIHTATWLNRRMFELFDRYLGNGWATHASSEDVWARVDSVPDAEIWSIRQEQREEFVRFVRKRVARDIERRTRAKADLDAIERVLDPKVLTVGFARRFATYKRATLLLNDRERLKQLLFHTDRPIQFVIAGKSHPRDDGGKRLIQELWHFIQHEGASERMVFMEDYDMRVARAMVQGVDVWLNNPRRPMEASGTSGMKVVPNGGLNLSILDGWWDEGYSSEVGWSIGDRGIYSDHTYQDWLDARSLYQTLEQDVASKFYRRDGGVPRDWVQMMKRSMATLSPQFSTIRMVQEYAEHSYFPAHDAFHRLGLNHQERSKLAISWIDRVRKAWDSVQIVTISDDSNAKMPVGRDVTVTAVVELSTLQPVDVSVDLLQGRIGTGRELQDVIERSMTLVSSSGTSATFQAQIPTMVSGHRGYAVRIRPSNADVASDHELRLIRWEN